MKKDMLLTILRQTARAVPDVFPRLSPPARKVLSEPSQYKTYEFFLSAIEGLVNGVYNGYMGGVFIDTMANLISGQLTDAYIRAWADDGQFTELPEYLQTSLDDMILSQYGYVDQYYRDIVDARVDKTPIAPLLVRATLWANRWMEAYNNAMLLITKHEGGNMVWQLGETERHCTVCAGLNGIVARASEWAALGVKPQNAPNNKLTCGGWQCDCSLTPTEKRRTRDAYGRIEEILLAG
jgi:hypothetical protein